MAFTIENNMPSAGNIRWTNLGLQYKGVDYAITNGYTNYIYVYWTPASPATLVVSNTFPTLGVDDCLLFLNKAGTAVVVPNATVLNGDLIVPGSIVANALAANTITGDKIAAGTITAANILAGTISATQIAANAIGATAISADSITGAKIVVDAITSREIAAATITATEIAAGTITAAKMAAGTITAASGIIADAAITSAKIVSLDASKVTTGSMTADRIVGGTMVLGGLNNVSGVISVKNASGVEVAKIDSLGFLVTHTGANSQTSLQGDGFKILKTSTGEVVASITGDDLGFSSLTAGSINSPSVQNVLRGNLTYYVNASTGLDTNTGLAAGTAFKTIQKAINILNKILEGNAVVTINVAAGTYNESLTIRNFSGGTIAINFPAATTTSFLNGGIIIQDCTAAIKLFGGRTTYNTTDGCRINYATYDIVVASRSKYVEVVGFVIVGSYGVSGLGNGVAYDTGTVGWVYHCDISRCNDAIAASSGSIVTAYDNCGSNNGAGTVAAYSAVVNFPSSSWCPTGGANIYVQMSGRIVLEGTVAYSASVCNPPAAPPQTTGSWSASLTKSYRATVGWHSSTDVYQGQYTGSAYPCYTGCMWFSGFIAAVVTTVKSARLYLSRYSAGGTSASQDIYLRGVAETGTGGGCTIIKDYGWIGSLAWGQSAWMTIPNQAIVDYNVGTIGGLALYDGNPNYVIAYGPVLEVTYT